MKLLIKYATRGRLPLFLGTLENIADTISPGTDYLILVMSDYDDPSMNSMWLADEVQGRWGNKVLLCSAPNKSKIEAINALVNEVKTPWDWLVNVSDDMRFMVRDWDRFMLADIRKQWPTGTDWFAHFNDGYAGERLPTMSIMGREYYDRDKYIYYPEYRSLSADAEAMFVAQMRGRHAYFPDVYFHHIHPGNGRGRTDATYKRNADATDSDAALLFKRLRQGFDLQANEIVNVPDTVQRYMDGTEGREWR